MRFLLLLVACGLLFLSAAAAPLPADTAILQVSRLPAKGLLLKQGWRYQVGDNPQWARPDFNDSAWDTINPTRPRRELPAALGSGISWLRLHFRLADSLRQQELVVNARLLGACDIYLNGQLLAHQGTLDANPAQVQPQGWTGPVVLPKSARAEQVLAVRYAPWQPLLRGSSYSPQLAVRLSSPPQYWQGEARRKGAVAPFLVLVGISALLTLLHLAFFRYNPAQRANLYFAGFALTVLLGSLTYYYYSVSDFPAPVFGMSVLTVARTLGIMSGLWSMRALYALFTLRPGRLYAAFWVGYGALVVLLILAPYHPAALLAMVGFGILTTAEQLRMTTQAMRQGKRGAGIIGAGYACELLAGFACIGVIVLYPNGLLLNLLLMLTSVLRALGISLFLAREFALDSQLLQVKLSEVERLSAQTLAQEQDKQALLAAQNETLEQQVQQRTEQLQRSLTDLRATQAQLIQKEKMASLGELTAGIAHEIQNPLNFVTNFSDLSSELVAELREEQAKGVAADAALQEELFEDLTQNLDKIGHHGRRAAGIVKGMLEHSQTSAGERRPTNLNALTEEYLRLAYQGLRAKDKSFNVELTTDFAIGLTPVTMVGPDVGRVLLNLFTNAFYAVRQRQQQGEAGYQPTVRVSTQQVEGQVHLRVQDNGTGMSQAVREKIFQPFFTTKPPGEGTGLGLSLSYDIIAQGHGGGLAVESQEGHGSEFTISLPH
ncbi:histidine kinase [Hymenobacter roseosalivarius DSM 11622]|uniref:histidine kinase n=1 Tax=Hymenobacter roseosalivarius DSM 11622 TaxID=645990 RepID=A0A1W1W306_9BACT|nr:ATP-binding protein [Hymenobacter roseosalivarius]SMC00009.1 histidine kinase [Hymenobacter roseosalivarius DSM 11622]